jgi:hypothetical protein
MNRDPTDDEADWAPITWETIPSRADMEFETIDLIENYGITDADDIRDRIRRKRRLVVQPASGGGNNDPSSKFVDEHVLVLNYLLHGGVLKHRGDKEYALDRGALARWRALDRTPGQAP